jgi:DNA polymerase-1
VEAKLAIAPAQVVDYKALCGDSSDNIPGVRGIGAKTAVKLLQEFGDLDSLYANLDKIKGANQKKLQEGRESAYHSRFMATIVTDVDLETDLEGCRLQGFDPQRVVPALQKLEFQHFIQRLDKLQVAFGGAVSSTTATQNEPPAASMAEPAPSLPAVTLTPQIITTAAQLYELLDTLSTHTDPTRPVAWDTETTSLDPMAAALVGIGCAWGPGATEAAYIPVGHQQGEQLPLALVLAALAPVLESDRYPKALQNAKYDRLVLRQQGLHLQGWCLTRCWPATCSTRKPATTSRT